MRVKDGVHTVSGTLRHAVYDLEQQVCTPLQDEDLAILRGFASGITPHPASVGLTSAMFWARVASLRKRRLLEPGRPVRYGLALQVEHAFQLPRTFKRVWFEITNACNLSCDHCYSDSSPTSNRDGDLTSEQWKKIARKFLDYGVDWITLIGGEPLVRLEVVINLVSFIRDSSPDTKIVIFSNLIRMPRDEAWFKFLREKRVQIGTSLYGRDSEMHDKVTHQHGSWSRTTTAIKALRDHLIPVFAGIYLDKSVDIDEEPYHIWARSLGLLTYEINVPSKVGRGRNLEWNRPSEPNTLPTIKQLNFGSTKQMGWKHNCYHDHLAIRHDGAAMPCIMTRDHVGLNMVSGAIADYLASTQYLAFASLTKEVIEGCEECEFRYGCFDCRPEARADTGNLRRKPDCGYDPRLPLGRPLISEPVPQSLFQILS